MRVILGIALVLVCIVAVLWGIGRYLRWQDGLEKETRRQQVEWQTGECVTHYPTLAGAREICQCAVYLGGTGGYINEMDRCLKEFYRK